MALFAVTAPNGEVTFPLTLWLTDPDDKEHALQLAREQLPDINWDAAEPIEDYWART